MGQGRDVLSLLVTVRVYVIPPASSVMVVGPGVGQGRDVWSPSVTTRVYVEPPAVSVMDTGPGVAQRPARDV